MSTASAKKREVTSGVRTKSGEEMGVEAGTEARSKRTLRRLASAGVGEGWPAGYLSDSCFYYLAQAWPSPFCSTF